MTIQHNISLQPLNTFGIQAEATNLITITSEDQLAEVGAMPDPKHIIGGGSNILLTTNPGGLVLLNRLKGIEQIQKDDSYIYLRVASGEVWHHLVMHTVQQGLGGIENLALIPGTVGASPMQNIGAYGVEVKDTIQSVTFWHWADAKMYTYTAADCHFGYRESIFKRQLKDQVYITSVVYKLSKHPVLNTSYGAIEQELQDMHVATPTVATVAQAVINIRSSKLPDPAVTGNAGSFFKNPTIPITQYEALKTQHPAIPSYPVTPETVKVPAGWLIEQCGWKGYRRGHCGVHPKQALVLVNYGNALGTDIWQLSTDILRSVQEKFGIELEREVNVW